MGSCLGKKSIEKQQRCRKIKYQIDQRILSAENFSQPLEQTELTFSSSLDLKEISIGLQTEQNHSILSTPLEIEPNAFLLHNSNGKRFKTDEETNRSESLINSISSISFNEIQDNDDDEKLASTIEKYKTTFDNSPASSLSKSSLSSTSPNTTLFSSDEDQLIISSSSSSMTHESCRSLKNSELISFDNQTSKENFEFQIPMASLRNENERFFSEFHENLKIYRCDGLSSIIDDIVQQRASRIHRRSNSFLIEHEQLNCIDSTNLNDETRSILIFDEREKLVFLTKSICHKKFQSILTIGSDFSLNSSEQCVNFPFIFPNSTFIDRVRSFLLVNVTHQLAVKCLNDESEKRFFGYVSTGDIRQTLIDRSKWKLSSKLIVNSSSFHFVLKLDSWPESIRTNFQQRSRRWPLNSDTLFDQTCFIRMEIQDEKMNSENFSSASPIRWSLTFIGIEAKLVSFMSDEQRRFATLAWNFLQSKSDGKMPFKIFKNLIFHFFEQNSFEQFVASDSRQFLRLFFIYSRDCFLQKSIQHYFDWRKNLFQENLDIDWCSIELNFLDLKRHSIRQLSIHSLYVDHFIYLIQHQSILFSSLGLSRQHPIDSIVEFDCEIRKQSKLFQLHRPVTFDYFYRIQEKNVSLIFDYLSLLRQHESSLRIHSLCSIFLQILNCWFDDVFINDKEYFN